MLFEERLTSLFDLEVGAELKDKVALLVDLEVEDASFEFKEGIALVDVRGNFPDSLLDEVLHGLRVDGFGAGTVLRALVGDDALLETGATLPVVQVESVGSLFHVANLRRPKHLVHGVLPLGAVGELLEHQGLLLQVPEENGRTEVNGGHVVQLQTLHVQRVVEVPSRRDGFAFVQLLREVRVDVLEGYVLLVLLQHVPLLRSEVPRLRLPLLVVEEHRLRDFEAERTGLRAALQPQVVIDPLEFIAECSYLIDACQVG